MQTLQFAGNLLREPAFHGLERGYGQFAIDARLECYGALFGNEADHGARDNVISVVADASGGHDLHGRADGRFAGLEGAGALGHECDDFAGCGPGAGGFEGGGDPSASADLCGDSRADLSLG